MKYICISFLVILCFVASCAFASDKPTGIEKPEDVVRLLYRDFGWEFTSDVGSKTVLVDQPETVLKQYFTRKLVKLILNDRKFEARTREIGHLDFILLTGSQDPDGIGNIRIARKPGTNIVSVMYDQNGEKDVMKIDYHCVHTASGWRISDIRYKSRKSLAFPVPEPELSLLKHLSQPY